MEQNIGKFSLSYLKKILSLWDEKGVHTVAEITALEPESARRQQTAQPVSAPTQPDKLENWERDWMEEVQRRKRQRAKEE